MMAKPNIAAAAHLAAGALAKVEDVPVGNHDLSRIEMVLSFPDFCAVGRAAGTDKDGWNSRPGPPLAITLGAVLLFLERVKAKAGEMKELTRPGDLSAAVQNLWAECIRDDLKNIREKPPLEALAALQRV